MADGAWAMTNSSREVYGKLVRLMCWTHTHRNYSKKLPIICKVNKELAKSLDVDIQKIQWMSQTEDEFRVVFSLLEEKYLKGDFTVKELEQLNIFFDYFREQWGPDSHVSKWYEGAHPYHISHNQGIERRNLEIKEEFSYREQLNMGQFATMMEKICNEYSKKDDSILFSSRVNSLRYDSDGRKEKESFRIQEEGFKYYKDNLEPLPSKLGEPVRRKPGKVLEINPHGKVTLSSNPGIELGPVIKIIALPNQIVSCLT